MQKEDCALPQRSQIVAGTEPECSPSMLASRAAREAALEASSQQGAMQERPYWAPSDLEDIYCDAVELICSREDISWQTFFEQAEEGHPNLPIVSQIRIEVTEYFRASVDWLLEAPQAFADALHKQPLVGLEEAVVTGWYDQGTASAGGVSLDRQVPV